jgi:hypothetical protein
VEEIIKAETGSQPASATDQPELSVEDGSQCLAQGIA